MEKDWREERFLFHLLWYALEKIARQLVCTFQQNYPNRCLLSTHSIPFTHTFDMGYDCWLLFLVTGTPPIRRKSVNLDEIPEGEEGEEEGEGKEHCSICSPHNIELLKQFVEGCGYTIAIKWELPLNLPQDATGYNVCVNGDVKMFVSNPLETTVMLSAIPRHTVSWF